MPTRFGPSEGSCPMTRTAQRRTLLTMRAPTASPTFGTSVNCLTAAVISSEPREAFDVGSKVLDHRRRERRARFGDGLQVVLSCERRFGAIGRLHDEALEGGLSGFAGGEHNLGWGAGLVRAPHRT